MDGRRIELLTSALRTRPVSPGKGHRRKEIIHLIATIRSSNETRVKAQVSVWCCIADWHQLVTHLPKLKEGNQRVNPTGKKSVRLPCPAAWCCTLNEQILFEIILLEQRCQPPARIIAPSAAARDVNRLRAPGR